MEPKVERSYWRQVHESAKSCGTEGSTVGLSYSGKCKSGDRVLQFITCLCPPSPLFSGSWDVITHNMPVSELNKFQCQFMCH